MHSIGRRTPSPTPISWLHANAGYARAPSPPPVSPIDRARELVTKRNMLATTGTIVFLLLLTTVRRVGLHNAVLRSRSLRTIALSEFEDDASAPEGAALQPEYEALVAKESSLEAMEAKIREDVKRRAKSNGSESKSESESESESDGSDESDSEGEEEDGETR